MAQSTGCTEHGQPMANNYVIIFTQSLPPFLPTYLPTYLPACLPAYIPLLFHFNARETFCDVTRGSNFLRNNAFSA